MPILFVILATALWGVSYLFTKLAFQEVSTATFLFFRYTSASLFLLPIFFLQPIALNKKLIKQGIHLSVLQTIVIFSQTIGLETISASLSSFVAGFYIVFVLIIRFILTKKLPNAVDIITTLLCLAGLGLLTHSFGNPDPLGIGYTFISALFFAIYIYVLDKYVNKDLAFALTFLQVVGIMLCCGVVLLWNGPPFQLPTKLGTWGGIICSGIGSSSLAYWLVAKAQSKLGAFQVSIIMMLEPVFATIFAYFGLDETLYPTSFLGIGMILTAITVINKRLKKVS